VPKILFIIVYLRGFILVFVRTAPCTYLVAERMQCRWLSEPDSYVASERTFSCTQLSGKEEI
jgi:hypothetical protein